MTCTLTESKQRLLDCNSNAAHDLAIVAEILTRSGPDPLLEQDSDFLRKLIRVTRPSFVRTASASQISAIWQAIEAISEDRAFS
jgi:hypothetical protein